MSTSQPPNLPDQKKVNPVKALNLWAITTEVGFIIALPLVILVLVAVKLDRHFDTLPLFIILAILISPALSGLAIWRKVKVVTKADTL